MVNSKKIIARYRALKREVPDCILLMQVMDNDAKTLSQLTGLKLQMAGEVGDPVVLGGFPKSGLNAYVGTMTRAGYSVAIAFQDEQKERHIKEIIRVNLVELKDGAL